VITFFGDVVPALGFFVFFSSWSLFIFFVFLFRSYILSVYAQCAKLFAALLPPFLLLFFFSPLLMVPLSLPHQR